MSDTYLRKLTALDLTIGIEGYPTTVYDQWKRNNNCMNDWFSGND